MEITNIQTFINYYTRIRERTLRVVNCIPADKLEWTYREGKFTFGDILRHLAALERFMFAENFQGRPSCYPGHNREQADGYEAVLAFLNKMHSETIAIISALDEDDLQKKCITAGGVPITTWKWMRAMVEHEVHHRAQIYIYLQILGVETPPLYGLTEEEVFEKSSKMEPETDNDQ